MALGDIQKAISSYQDALKYEPENLEYYYHLIDLKKEILDSNLKNKIDSILSNSKCTKNNFAYGNFLLSKYEQKNRNYKKEFDYLLKGHQFYFDSEEKKKQKRRTR